MHHHAMQQPIMHAYEMQMLRNKTKARRNSEDFSTKLFETSPPLGIDCQNGRKAKKTNIKGVPPKVVYFSTRERNAIHISKGNTWRKSNYIEAPRLQKNDMPQRHNKERNKQSSNQKIPIESSNQRISIEPTSPNILRAT